MKKKYKYILVAAVLIPAGTFLPDLSGRHCCCKTPVIQRLSSCSYHPGRNMTILEPLCCCTFRPGKCSLYQAWDLPPVNTVNVELQKYKTSTDNKTLNAFPGDVSSVKSRDGPCVIQQFIPPKNLLYLTNCSFLC